MTRKEMKKRIARKLLYGDLNEIHVKTFDLDLVLNEGKVVFYSHVVNLDPTKNYVNDTKTETVYLNDDNWKIWFSNGADKNNLNHLLAANVSMEKVGDDSYIIRGFSSQYIDPVNKYQIINENYVEDVQIKPNQSVIAIYPNTISAPIIVIDDNKELNVPDLDNCIKYMYAENYEFNSLNYNINVYDKEEEHLGIKTITAEQKSHIMMTVTSAQRETKKYDEDGKLIYYSNPVTKMTRKREGNIMRTYYDGNLLYECDEETYTPTLYGEFVKDETSGMTVRKYYNSDLVEVFTKPTEDNGKSLVISTIMDGEKTISKTKTYSSEEGTRVEYEDCSGIKYELITDPAGNIIMYHDIDYDVMLSNGRVVRFNSPYLFADSDKLYVRAYGIPDYYIHNLDYISKDS
jgi:hypothetical protein